MSYNPPTRIPFLYIFGNICYLVFLKIVILICMKWYLIVSICISLKISDIALVFYVTLERAMATHSSTLAWKTPWMEEPGRLQSMGSLGIRHDWVTSFFHFHALEKEMETHFSVLAWRIPRMVEPSGLTFMGLHRVIHDWSDLAAAVYVTVYPLYVFFEKMSIWKKKVLVTQSCLTFCHPKDCSLPFSSVHGIIQARILEWVAIPFSRGSSWSRDQTQVWSCTAGSLYHLSHQGSHLYVFFGNMPI